MKKQTDCADINQSVDVNPDDIIEYCQANFINILPNTLTKEADAQNQQKPKHQAVLHQKQEIKIIVRQLSILLQLTIQNCVLTCDPKIKYHSNMILGTFQELLSRDLDDFQNMSKNRNRIKLPFYQVDCKDFMNRDVVIKIPPQVSLYQDPLLYYKYSKFAQEQLFCNLSIMKTREERIELIKNHVPFLDPNFIPILGQRLQTKAKFSELQDRLLLIYLTMHEKKDIGQYKSIYFPQRKEGQIRNRAKNLCAKQLINPIKKLRENQYLLLTETQIKLLVRAFKRFGPRWQVIAKYFRLRSESMLEAQYVGCQKLSKLRKSYDITADYGGSIKDILTEQSKKQSEQQEIKHKNKENEGVQQVNLQSEQCKDFDEFSQVYKIIGHLTFLYEQI